MAFGDLYKVLLIRERKGGDALGKDRLKDKSIHE